jgi:hypothetical protein
VPGPCSFASSRNWLSSSTKRERSNRFFKGEWQRKFKTTL